MVVVEWEVWCFGARSKEHGRAKVARGGHARFLFWHSWKFVGKVFGLFLWFLCLRMCLGDGSLAKRVA